MQVVDVHTRCCKAGRGDSRVNTPSLAVKVTVTIEGEWSKLLGLQLDHARDVLKDHGYDVKSFIKYTGDND